MKQILPIRRAGIVVGCMSLPIVLALCSFCLFVVCPFFLFGNYSWLVQLPIIASIGRVDTSTAMVTFDDPCLDILIDYPKPWQTFGGCKGFTGGKSIQAEIVSLGWQTTYIRKLNYPAQVSLDEVAADRLQDWQKTVEEFDATLTYSTISTTRLSVDSTPALLAEYKAQIRSKHESPLIGGPEYERVLELYLERGGIAYIVTFQATEFRYPQLEPIFRRMIQSIRFRK